MKNDYITYRCNSTVKPTWISRSHIPGVVGLGKNVKEAENERKEKEREWYLRYWGMD